MQVSDYIYFVSFNDTFYICWLPTQHPVIEQSIQLLCMIKGFCHEIAENCALLGHYAVSHGNYQYSPSNDPEEHSSEYSY